MSKDKIKPDEPVYQVWQHKKTKKQHRVMPWWECLTPILDEKDVEGFKKGLSEKRKLRIGALVQIGWLLENKQGIWIGVGLTASKEFKQVKKK